MSLLSTFLTLSTANVFEIVMLLCFAFSWPISIAKTLRTKIVIGKSPLFMIVIMIGYASGIMHKIFNNFNWVTYLYLFNLFIVSFDLFLYFYYSKKNIMEQQYDWF